MNDEQLGRDIVAALLKDDPGAVPAGLRGRVADVPEEAARGRAAGLRRSSGVSRTVRMLEAVAAVVVVGALVAGTLILRGSSVGLAPAGSASPSAATSEAPSLPNPTVLITPTPEPKWTGLTWSAATAIPGAEAINDITFFNGQYFAAGRAGTSNSSGGQLPVGIWRSVDGFGWTQVSLDPATFYNANITGLAVAPVGLVAWGTMGDPVCSGEGEGMTCGPMPVMMWMSQNGSDWSRVAIGSVFENATVRAVAYGSLGLVAVGDTGFNQPAIWNSQSGLSWVRQTLDTAVFQDAHLSSITETGRGYVIGGSTGGAAPVSGGVQAPATGVAAAWWSDGRAWHKATVNSTGGVGASIDQINVGAAGMVAIGSLEGAKAGVLWISGDGRAWQSFIDSTLLSFNISSDGTRVVAIGDGDNGRLAIWVSDDGASWGSLGFSGATADLPSGPTATTSGARAFVVPNGLIVISTPSKLGAPIPVWRVYPKP
ncbi:MAG TPA: hypothetical protein VF337_08170 [Candidatus Limnocylindrales bacterium]